MDLNEIIGWSLGELDRWKVDDSLRRRLQKTIATKPQKYRNYKY